MIIRQAKPSDMDKLYALFKRFCKKTGQTCNKKLFIKYATKMISYPHSTIYLLEVDDTICGFMDLTLATVPVHPYRIAYSQWFYVDKIHSDKSGYLFKRIISIARKKKVAEIIGYCGTNMLKYWDRHKFKKHYIHTVIRRL